MISDNKKKIAVLGACCSRDIFNKKFVADWRESFDVVLYQYQPSFIALNACPIPFSRKLLKKYHENVIFDDLLQSECTKDLYNNLLSVNPEILLIDFYSDVINGVLKINDHSYIVNRKKEWENNDLFLSMGVGNEIRPQKHHEKYMKKWKEGFDLFMGFMKKYLPETVIMINSARCTNVVMQDDGSTYVHKFGSDVDKLNDIWNEMDDYASGKYHIIRLENKKEYYLTPDYEFGFMWIVHYRKNYYEDRMEQLLKETAKCKISDSAVSDQAYTGNLLLNGDFSLGTLFWKFWNKSVSLKDDRLELNKTGDEKNKWYQCWSLDVETDNLKKDTYIVSFDCMINDIESVNGKKAIFGIRIFNKKNLLSQKDSIQSFFVEAKDNYQVGEWEHYEMRFVPEGKYISVGPFIARNANIKWKNIMLKKCSGSLTPDNEYVKTPAEQLLMDEEDCLIDVNRVQITNLKQIKIV